MKVRNIVLIGLFVLLFIYGLIGYASGVNTSTQNILSIKSKDNPSEVDETVNAIWNKRLPVPHKYKQIDLDYPMQN